MPKRKSIGRYKTNKRSTFGRTRNRGRKGNKKGTKKKKNKRKKKNKMRGGLKPTILGQSVNNGDPQDSKDQLTEFIYEMEALGITYPPFIISSDTIHMPNLDLAQETINYKVLSIDGKSITLEINRRALRNVDEEETLPIKVGPHTEHDWHRYRVFTIIDGKNYYIEKCSGNVVTFMEDINGKIKENETIGITRNRAGDFVIYTKSPTKLRYLDNQLQIDYQVARGGRVGHVSLLNNPEEYSSAGIRGDETDESREGDTILFAGEINWKCDGRALFYLNVGGRYQPDLGDVNYLAKINSQFDLLTVTADTTETDGDPKFFFRAQDNVSGLVCTCEECSNQSDVRTTLSFPGHLRRPRTTKRVIFLCEKCAILALKRNACYDCASCNYGQYTDCVKNIRLQHDYLVSRDKYS